MADPTEHLEKAIRLLSGPKRCASVAARAIGVSPQRLHNWRSRGVPVDQCVEIERVTGGEVRCEELRPDYPWDHFRSLSDEGRKCA
ncbi:YdaS family helix-turn-helix protein [Algiphilus sp.]|uniref:transcriptional regulator n=1 Tax=Algiphilus sp. TaxID=1872431 RepID=UPI003454DEED|nr:helix-turn-helix domain-containing protein [Algiphilus sp.]